MSQSKLASSTGRTYTGSCKDNLVIGLDPGVTRFGMHAEYGQVPVMNATFASDKPYRDQCVFARTHGLSAAVMMHLYDFIYCMALHEKADIIFAVETPIFNGRNPKAFEIQWRLYQDVVSSIYHLPESDWIVEVNNKTAKMVATGNGSADKMDIICASPYDGPGEWNAEGTKAKADYNDNQEAVADAWAIAQCAYRPDVGTWYPCARSLDASRGPIIENVGIEC